MGRVLSGMSDTVVHSFIKVPGNHFRRNKELTPQAAIVKRTSGLVNMISLIVGF